MEKSSSISKDDIQDIDLIRLEDFITAKEEPCSFDEIAQEFPKFNIDSLRKLLQNLSQQEKIGTLTFSNRREEAINKRTLNIKYLKISKEKKSCMEKSYDKNEENLEDLSEKLDLLKKKQSNIDKSLKNIQNNSFYKLIHEYNEIKDSCSAIIGKLAEIQGISVNKLFQEYDISSTD